MVVNSRKTCCHKVCNVRRRMRCFCDWCKSPVIFFFFFSQILNIFIISLVINVLTHMHHPKAIMTWMGRWHQILGWWWVKVRWRQGARCFFVVIVVVLQPGMPVIIKCYKSTVMSFIRSLHVVLSTPDGAAKTAGKHPWTSLRFNKNKHKHVHRNLLEFSPFL